MRINPLVDLANQIINLTHHRTHFDFRIQQPGRSNNLFSNIFFRNATQFIRSWRCAHIKNPFDMFFKLINLQRSIVQGTWQTEPIINQHLFPGPIAIIHAFNLWHRNVTFINHNRKVFREKVEQRIRRFSGFPTIHVARVIFNPTGKAHFAHHFNIIISTLL